MITFAGGDARAANIDGRDNVPEGGAKVAIQIYRSRSRRGRKAYVLSDTVPCHSGWIRSRKSKAVDVSGTLYMWIREVDKYEWTHCPSLVCVYLAGDTIRHAPVQSKLDDKT